MTGTATRATRQNAVRVRRQEIIGTVLGSLVEMSDLTLIGSKYYRLYLIDPTGFVDTDLLSVKVIDYSTIADVIRDGWQLETI